jgi:hypothetical protein
LAFGRRGLPSGMSLARLLAEHRGRRYHLDLPPLSVEQVLAWADAHFRRTGRWPTTYSGPIEGSAGETWGAIHHALIVGSRGFRGGSTLFRFLVQQGRKSPIGGKEGTRKSRLE